MAKPIVLIGFPCCGKTTLGRGFALRIGRDFYDLDNFVAHSNGCLSAADFIRKKGLKHFRLAESKGLKNLLSSQDIVIACGGGTPCEADNMRLIKEWGCSIYIEEDKKVLLARLVANNESRPLIAGKSLRSIEQWLESVWQARHNYYIQADVRIGADQFREMIESC